MIEKQPRLILDREFLDFIEVIKTLKATQKQNIINMIEDLNTKQSTN